MLYEISCDKFISNGNPRGIIRFNSGLNIVQGQNTGTNSIGKSSFLLAVDFAFGGDDYAKDEKIITHIGHHLVKFCFAFDNNKYYFSRSTDTKHSVNYCDENFTVQETKNLSEYLSFLFGLYKIRLPHTSFRNVLGRYFRIYGRDNSNERLPLAAFRAESQEESLSAFLKLYNRYAPISQLHTDLERLTKDKEAITKQKKVLLIKKRAYKENLAKLDALQVQLTQLENGTNLDLLALDPDQAEKAAELKAQIDTLNRKKKRLWTQYYNVKNASEFRRPATTQEFDELLKYFPNSNIQQLAAIESFHASLTNILGAEFAEAMSSALEQINRLSREIEALEATMNEMGVSQDIRKKAYKAYASVSRQIDVITEENDLYDEKAKIEQQIKAAKQNYANIFMEQIAALKDTVNAKMEELNALIYGAESIPPILNVLKPNSYEFGTVTDGGTGTNYKNLILLDLTALNLTPLPALAHDTIIFKQIAQEPMGKIIELYAESEKQIFIAIDEKTKYPDEAQKIVAERTILQLSEDGNELYGTSWVKRTDSEV